MGRRKIRELGGRCKYGHRLTPENVSRILRKDRRNLVQIVCKSCQALASLNYERRKLDRPEAPKVRKSFEQWAGERMQGWRGSETRPVRT